MDRWFTKESTISGSDGYVRVASLADLPPGSSLDVDAGEEAVLLVNVAGEIHAMSAWCTHLGTALALGRLADHVLTCSAHLWSFDVRTGEPIWPPIARIAPGYRLRRYPVRVDGEAIFVSPTLGRGASSSSVAPRS